MILITQSLVHYGFLRILEIPTVLSHFEFGMLSLASLCIAAAGYIINDIEDLEIDRINRPKTQVVGRKISEKKAFNYYLLLNILGVGVGYFLSLRLGLSSYAAFFVFISAILYSYATFIKRILILGNLVVSLVVASSIIILIFFDLSPLVTTNYKELVNPASVIRDYAIFAFLLNFLREIIKDIEDMDGDYAQGLQTLPIILGRVRTAKCCSIAALVLTGILTVYIYNYLYTNPLTTSYLLFVVGGSLLFFAVTAWSAKSRAQFSRLSNYLKISMIFGILSLGVLSLSLLYYA